MSSGVSDADLLTKFREIGEASIQMLILEHFRHEFGRPELDLNSSVFEQPTTSSRVFLNQLAVRKCLYDNWSGIQESYPCIHDFEYVVGDADCMYVLRFPHINLRTGRVHGVEKVQDFVDFIFELLQYICIPCLDPLNKDCVATRRRMREALEKCKTSVCTETRENLLRFFIDDAESISSMGASSAMNLNSHKGVGQTSNPPSPYWSSGENPRSYTFGRNVPKFEDDTSAREGRGLENWHLSRENDMMLTMTTKFGELGQEYGAEGLLPGRQDVMLHTQQLENLANSGQTIKRSTVWGFMSPLVNTRDTMHQVDFVDGQILLDSVAIRGVLQSIPDKDRKAWEEQVNTVAEAIENDKDLSVLARLTRLHFKQKYRFTMMVKGGQDGNGGWKTKALVYVVDDNIYFSDIEQLRNFLESKEGRELSMFFETSDSLNAGVKPILDHRNNVPFGHDHDRDIRNFYEVMGVPFDPENPGNSTAVFAEAVRKAWFGEGPNFLNNDYVVAVILISASTDRENPRVVDDMIELASKNNHRREQLVKVKASDALALCLKRAHELANLTGKPDLASEETQSAITDAPKTLQDAVETNLRQYINSFAQKGADDVAEKQVHGWAEFMRYRDSDDPEKREMAKKAFEHAQKLRKWRNRWQGLRYRILKDYHRALTPGDGDASWTYRKVKASIKDEKEADLFEKLCEKIIFGQLIDDLDGVTYEDIMDCWLDVAFAWEEITPRTFEKLLKPSEYAYLRDAQLFIYIWLALIAMGVGAGLKWPLRGKDATDDNGQHLPGEIIEENVVKQQGSHAALHAVALATEIGGERYDLLVVHLVTAVMMLAVKEYEQLALITGKGVGGAKSMFRSIFSRGGAKKKSSVIAKTLAKANRTSGEAATIGPQSQTRSGRRIR